MTEPLLVALLIMLAAATVGIGLPTTLRRLPEPAGSDSDDEPPKIAYADLVRPGFLIGCVVVTAVVAAIGVLWMPREVVAVWLVLAAFGVSLAGIDGATTWLPMRLCYVAWIAMALAIVGTSFVIADAGWLLRTVAGAVIAGVVYLAIWTVSRGGFGFGDVRFAPLLGAAAASGSWTLLLWAMLCGAITGGAFGLFRIIIGRRGGFPYAPAMLAGVYLAILLTRPPPMPG